jgi:twinkle protein
MGDIAVRNQPCLDPSCGSSDARQIYGDGTSFCFSCQEFFSKEEGDGVAIVEERKQTSSPSPYKKLSVDDILELPIRGFADRAIKKKVNEYYGVRVSYDSNGAIEKHYYPYGNNSWKVRTLPKVFSWFNKTNALFGQDKFNGAGKRLIICEGEIDTLSVALAYYDKYDKIYPVVGMSSSSMTKSLLENRDWIRSFQEVVLCLDEDAAGEKAVNEAVKIIGIDKVKLTKLPYNDANDVLTKDGSYRLLQCIYDAAPYIPSGIIGKEALWDALIEYNSKPSHPYAPCLHGINSKLKGKREGEIALFISGTGSGKSTMLREEMLNILETTNDRIGIVSLEEAPAETARKLAGMQLERNPANEEIPLEELKVGFDKVFGDDRIILLDHQGSINDNSIIDQLEYMALSGCKYLFIDHITILVSEGVDNLTGNEAQDKVMNDLLRLTKRHPIWIGLVSHLRKVQTGQKSFEQGKLPTLDDIRGSGSIKQISFDIIAFARNMEAEDDRTRNTIKMSVLKSRFTGLTGRVEGAMYNHTTGRLAYLPNIPEEQQFVRVG